MNSDAIILDMDGTLLTNANEITEPLKDIVEQIRQQGIYVFIATGRTLKEAEDVLPRDFKVDGFVTANGMSVSIGETPLVEHVLPKQVVNEVVSLARKKHVYYEIHPIKGKRYVLKKDYQVLLGHLVEPKPASVEKNEWFSLHEEFDKEIQWVEELLYSNVIKMYFFSRDRLRMDEWKEELSVLQRDYDFSMFSSTNHNVEVTVANISKATGVRKLLEYVEIRPDQVIAVGDGENDLPLFEYVGYPVAMKNGSHVVQRAAKEVTRFTNEEDGLYHFLKETFLS
ncbi:Cof-type HAD-IIB family hydrolase [Halalkalibacter hemicellulosilyticus]|uniref:Hydrolase n=1 Tax=Halalkalibacter hemicellulosilyticusJCM 9152 TaxID=1236971 RepID=W4QC32_9BACI|nr:Cof-type HAD-IIB family hydrolase [Halalkalibacter hemicellulosilyticus]GAE28914.1 hydrolase [Halalkalibacter hemicellulosilyticusJCM 9152]